MISRAEAVGIGVVWTLLLLSVAFGVYWLTVVCLVVAWLACGWVLLILHREGQSHRDARDSTFARQHRTRP